jgi:hypothetical protein
MIVRYSGWLNFLTPNIFDSYTFASKFQIHMKKVVTLKVEVAGFSETLEQTHVLRCVWIQETFIWDGYITIEIVAFCTMIPCSLIVVTTTEVTLCAFFRLKLALKFRVFGSSKKLVSTPRRPRRPQFTLQRKNSNLINVCVTLVPTPLRRPNYEGKDNTEADIREMGKPC